MYKKTKRVLTKCIKRKKGIKRQYVNYNKTYMSNYMRLYKKYFIICRRNPYIHI